MFVEDTNFSKPEDLGESSDWVQTSQQVAVTLPEITRERDRDHLQTLSLAFTPDFAAERVFPPLKKWFFKCFMQ